MSVEGPGVGGGGGNGGTTILSALGSQSVQNLVSNVLVAITGLSVALLANTSYRIEFFCGVEQTSAVPDISTLFVYSGTVAFVGIGGHFGTGATIGNQVFRNDLSGQQSAALTANDFNFMSNYGIIRTTDAGALTVEARQNNTDAGNPTQIQAGSAYLMAIPLG